MQGFFSPIVDPQDWELSLVDEVVIPKDFRYGGYKFRGVSARLSTGGTVAAPADAVFRVIGADKTFIELQVNAFVNRRLIEALAWGVPTFYFQFEDGEGLDEIKSDDAVAGADALRAASAVTIVCVFQNRIVIDPALWADEIARVVTQSGNDAAIQSWQPFADAVTGAANSDGGPPVLILDHTGKPQPQPGQPALEVGIVIESPGAETVHIAKVIAEDKGDLRSTVARMHEEDPAAMPLANLWDSRNSFRLRPNPPAVDPRFAPYQFAALEDATTSSTTGEITVTRDNRHFLIANLHDWLASQEAIPSGETEPAFKRFTRGNLVTPLINGPAFFKDLFTELEAAQNEDGGFHLAGWAMFAQNKLTGLRRNDPQNKKLTLAQADAAICEGDLPLTLEQAAARIGAAKSSPDTPACCFLPTRFIQLEVDEAVKLLFFIAQCELDLVEAFGADSEDLDGSGEMLRLLIWKSVSDQTLVLEPSKETVDTLSKISGSKIFFANHPSTIDDNPLVPANAADDFPLKQGFKFLRHFGVYHEKFAIVQTAIDRVIGYCGGIDLKPNRLDEADHLAKEPFHDVHSRIEGEAVRDLAIAFKQRWDRDSKPKDLNGLPQPGSTPENVAINTPAENALGNPGGDIVQVARTCFFTEDAARRLEFAPEGERTIINTLISAIKAAREYIYIEDQYFTPSPEYSQALVDKVSSGDIRKLIITIPLVTDQPFGEYSRSRFINDLRAADNNRGILHIGYPRRRFTIPDNDIRSSSGKLILGEDMQPGLNSGRIILGPIDRLPDPPFWVAIEGELMWVPGLAPPIIAPPEDFKVFFVDRGTNAQVIKGGAPAVKHSRGAAATVIDITGINVHAKVMLIDDVFMSIGSANINRRGYYHDGEINILSIPESLKTSPDNPVASLRMKLWAEMLDLPEAMAVPLLEDPFAAAKLFNRSPLAGNRYTDVDAHPTTLLIGSQGGIIQTAFGGKTLLSMVVTLMLQYQIEECDDVRIFERVVDPTTKLEPNAISKLVIDPNTNKEICP